MVSTVRYDVVVHTIYCFDLELYFTGFCAKYVAAGQGCEQFIIIGTVNMSSMSALTPPTLTVHLTQILE